jgi:hypothetical protein
MQKVTIYKVYSNGITEKFNEIEFESFSINVKDGVIILAMGILPVFAGSATNFCISIEEAK